MRKDRQRCEIVGKVTFIRQILQKFEWILESNKGGQKFGKTMIEKKIDKDGSSREEITE